MAFFSAKSCLGDLSVLFVPISQRSPKASAGGFGESLPSWSEVIFTGAKTGSPNGSLLTAGKAELVAPPNGFAAGGVGPNPGLCGTAGGNPPYK